MRIAAFAISLVVTLASPAVRAEPVMTPPAVAQPLSGTWVNPKGSVKVKTGECGVNVCGWVVWANEQATADARAAGVDKLVGTLLLRDYRQVGTDQWQGRVYVPDMGGTYFSRMNRLDGDRLKISGCILGGWICKSQVWQKD